MRNPKNFTNEKEKRVTFPGGELDLLDTALVAIYIIWVAARKHQVLRIMLIYTPLSAFDLNASLLSVVHGSSNQLLHYVRGKENLVPFAWYGVAPVLGYN